MQNYHSVALHVLSNVHTHAQTSEWHLHTTFQVCACQLFKCTTRSLKHLKRRLLCLVAHRAYGRSLRVVADFSSHRVINHHPLVYGNGLETLSTPISCNYEPSERWTQGDSDFRLLGASWLMVWWVRFSPCRDFTGSLKPLKPGTVGSFFQQKKGKEIWKLSAGQ